MEPRQKKKRRSSILKSRKSLADVDSNAIDVTMTDDDRKGLKRRVSFANTYQVKEITRVADIAEKWPDPTPHVDTTNISDASRLSCSVPTKKPISDPDNSSLSSLLLAPLVPTTSDNFNDSNMELTTISSTMPQPAANNHQTTEGRQTVPFNGEVMMSFKQPTLEPMFMVKEETSEEEPGFPLYGINEDEEEDTAVVDSFKNVPVPSFLLSSPKTGIADGIGAAPLASPSTVEIIFENNGYDSLHSNVMLAETISNKSLPPLAARNYSARPEKPKQPSPPVNILDGPDADSNSGDNTVFLNETMEMTVKVPTVLSVGLPESHHLDTLSSPLATPSWLTNSNVQASRSVLRANDGFSDPAAPNLEPQDVEMTCKLTSVIQHHVTSPRTPPGKKCTTERNDTNNKTDMEFTCIVRSDQVATNGDHHVMEKGNDHSAAMIDETVEFTCMPQTFEKDAAGDGMELTLVHPAQESNETNSGGESGEYVTLYPKDDAETSMVETSPENRVIATSALYVTAPKTLNLGNQKENDDDLAEEKGGGEETEDVSTHFRKLSKARNSMNLYSRNIIRSARTYQANSAVTGPDDSISHSPKSPQYPHSPRESDIMSIQSPEKYTDRMLSSSMVAEDDINDLVSPEQMLGDECFAEEQESAANETKGDDNMFKFSPLESCEEEKCDLFEGSPALDAPRGEKRPAGDLDQPLKDMDEDSTKTLKKICLEEPDRVQSADECCDQDDQAVDAGSKESISELPSNEDALLMLNSMTEIQKVLPDSIGIQDFLQNYTEVRLGSYRKMPKHRQSLVPHKKPENIGENATAVFVQARSIPVCSKFLESVHEKMASLSEDVESLEQQIHSNNTEVMRRIRFGSEEESENLRAEVEDLAARCKQLAKAEWKRDKGKLYKALAKVKEETYKSDLQPIADCLNRFGKIEDLVRTAVEDLEQANSAAEAELQVLPKRLPTDDELRIFKEQKEEIERLSKRAEEARVAKEQSAQRWEEARSKMENLWVAVEERERSELDMERRKKEASESLALHKRHSLWEMTKDDRHPTEFTFLDGTLVVRALRSASDNQNVRTYQVEDKLPSARLTRRQNVNYKFVVGLLKRNVTPATLLEKTPDRTSLHRAINFASIHASKAKRLLKQISAVQSRFANVGLLVGEETIVADFDGDLPNRCSFQIEFGFTRDDGSASFQPTRFAFVETRTSFGNYDKAAIEGALREVYPKSFRYFQDLADAVLQQIKSNR